MIRGGKTVKKRKVAAWELTIPAATAVRSARAGAYEIVVTGKDGFSKTYPFQITGARFSADDPRTQEPSSFFVACERLPSDKLSFSVRAVSCWGKKSAPLTITT